MEAETDSEKLIMFHRFNGPDSTGLRMGDYIVADDVWWEESHLHIQWAFPLPEPSAAQPSSPVAGEHFYRDVQSDPVTKLGLMTLLARYFEFLYGSPKWRTQKDHNHLRITRVLRCLTLCGMGEVAQTFHDYCVASTSVENRPTIPAISHKFWREALKQ